MTNFIRRRRVLAVVLITAAALLIVTYLDLAGNNIDSLNVSFKNPYSNLYDKYKYDFDITRNHKANDSALHVIVMAQFRTGSTITGEILNQNPTLFYLFEPLRVPKCVEKFAMMDDNEDTNAKLLARINRCHFSPKSAACIANFRLGVLKSKNVGRICERLTGMNYNTCPTATPDLFRKECLKYRGRMAMKIIRGSLNDIQEVLANRHLNIKVIHLVRDPRGTANSRRVYLMSINERHTLLNTTTAETPVARGNQTFHIKSLRKVGLFDPPVTPERATINEMCRRIRHNVGIAMQRPEWLKGRYKLVRYEDMAAKPLETTRKIYEFLGESAPDNVLRWLDENTKDTVKSDQQMFNTHKNSSATSMKWRQYFSYYEARQVQGICGDVMKTLGYKAIRHHGELRDPSFPVIVPLAIGPDIAVEFHD